MSMTMSNLGSLISDIAGGDGFCVKIFHLFTSICVDNAVYGAESYVQMVPNREGLC